MPRRQFLGAADAEGRHAHALERHREHRRERRLDVRGVRLWAHRAVDAVDAPRLVARARERQPAAHLEAAIEYATPEMGTALGALIKFYQTGTFTVGNRLLAQLCRTSS